MQPEVHVAGEPTFPLWIENLFGNLCGGVDEFERHGLATGDEVAAAKDELRRFMTLGDGSAFFYWNRATAIR